MKFVWSWITSANLSIKVKQIHVSPAYLLRIKRNKKNKGDFQEANFLRKVLDCSNDLAVKLSWNKNLTHNAHLHALNLDMGVLLKLFLSNGQGHIKQGLQAKAMFDTATSLNILL